MARKYFGTDGIRGRVGVAPITPGFMLRLGWAVGKVFTERSEGRPSIVIGKDTRVSGYMLESALQAGLVSAGVDVELLGPLPTPGIALLTRSQNAAAGIVISASHNPYYDNGVKFFCENGSKLSDELEIAIEAAVDQMPETVDPSKLGKASRIADAASRYAEHCKSTFDANLTLRGLRLVVDCAHGATYHIAPKVFSDLGAEVVVMGASPDGYNINEKVGSTAPEALQAEVVRCSADLGIAFDGDGDRVQFISQHGDVIDGDQMLYVLAMHRLANGRADSGIVGTLMSNMGLELALARHGLQLARTKVGDRFVKERMITEGWRLGGESSGHIICSDVSTTGDGIIAALQLLSAIVCSVHSLDELLDDFQKFPQVLINVPVAPEFSFEKHPLVMAEKDAVDDILAGRGRLLLRSSGTESVVRIMIEGKNENEINGLAERVADAIRDAA